MDDIKTKSINVNTIHPKVALSNNIELINGAHILYTYMCEKQYIENAVSFISTGLKLGHGVIFIDNQDRYKKIIKRLEVKGHKKIQLENINFLNSDDFYMANEVLNINNILKTFSYLVQPFLDKGIPLRTWGNVQWQEQSDLIDKLKKYEEEADNFVRNVSSFTICAYNGNLLSANMQLEIMRSHQYIMTDTELFVSNLYSKNLQAPSISVEENLEEAVSQLKSKLEQNNKHKNELEKIIIERTKFLTSIIETSDDAILSKDINGIILSWNNGAEKIYGYKANEVIGKHISIFAPPELKHDNAEMTLTNIKKGEYIKHFETVNRRKDGKLIHISQTISPIYDNLGNIIGSLTIAKDISERKIYESEMIKLNRLNTLGELAASISHEVRNPMTTVRGFLQLLMKKANYNEDKNYFDLMIEELDRANSIISEFLSIGKNTPLELKTQNLNRVINNLVPLLQADALAKNNYIEVKLNDIPELLINEKQIRQVIINLVRNGLEAMSSGGKLTIRTYMDRDNTVLAVDDEGCGIEPEVLKSLGNPFFTTKKEGTGLGLATTYSICKIHNAQVDVKTSPKGTTFFIIFNKKMKEKNSNKNYLSKLDVPIYLLNDYKFFKILFNSIPLVTLIVNSEGRVYGINSVTEKMFNKNNKEIYLRKGGEVLHCIHAKDIPESCGLKDYCENCVIRNTALEAIKGNSIKRSRGEFVIILNEELKNLDLLVNASPLEYKGEQLALIILEDISGIIEE